MNAARIIGVLLIAGGVLALVYGGFSYTRERQDVKLGPIEFAVKETRRVDIPEWASIAAIVGGGILLLTGGRKR